jgi:hypothetical protein
MITEKMRKWLESLPDTPDKDVKYCVYMNRMQKRIEKELCNLLWLCKIHPEIFIDEDSEINDMTGKIVSHRRLKSLILCLKAINPTMDVELVLKNIKPDEETEITSLAVADKTDNPQGSSS